jgi:hypothetical protein
MARKPLRGRLSAADHQVLRRMARRVGGMDELIRQAKRAPRRHPKRGRPRGSTKYDDGAMLYGIECLCRVAKRERKMSRTAALEWLVDTVRLPFLGTRFGQSDRSTVERLRAKLKKGGFDKLPINIDRLTLAHDGSCAVSTRMPPGYVSDTF